MGLFGSIVKRFQDNWCKTCKTQMQTMAEQLYMMPMTVGHYTSHKDAAYYYNSLYPVLDKSSITTGYYACRGTAYQCPGCGRRATALYIFLPVRNEEKFEDACFFEKGEMDFLPKINHY